MQNLKHNLTKLLVLIGIIIIILAGLTIGNDKTGFLDQIASKLF